MPTVAELWTTAAVAIACMSLTGCTDSRAADADLDIDFVPPIDRADERAHPLRFGLYVTPDPDQNPIDQPERFTGYHTALDFEIFPDEAEMAVPVYSACDGITAAATTAEGYGGVIIVRCGGSGSEVTVLYGHLDPATFQTATGQRVEAGDHIAELAAAHTPQNGDNRKHLHFGIHRGTDIEYLGYVQSEAELSPFIDPETVLW